MTKVIHKMNIEEFNEYKKNILHFFSNKCLENGFVFKPVVNKLEDEYLALQPLNYFAESKLFIVQINNDFDFTGYVSYQDELQKYHLIYLSIGAVSRFESAWEIFRSAFIDGLNLDEIESSIIAEEERTMPS